MDQVILDLIDLHAHLFIIESIAFHCLFVLLDVLLILGDLATVALLVFLKGDTSVSQLTAHLIDRLASDLDTVHGGQLTLQVTDLRVNLELSLHKSILLGLKLGPIALHLRLNVDAVVVLPLATRALDISYTQ